MSTEKEAPGPGFIYWGNLARGPGDAIVKDELTIQKL